jgi:thymidylate synthase (FAD)
VSVIGAETPNVLEINGLLDGQAWVQVRDVYPSEVPPGYTSEAAAVACARTSFNMDLRTPKIDNKLLRFLTANGHTSPLESCHIRLRVHVPRFVATHILRHRTGSFNELSQRYAQVGSEYFTPTYNNGEGIRFGGTINKQSSQRSDNDDITVVNEKMKSMNEHIDGIFEIYNDLITNHGVAKEVARYALPSSTYTTLEVQFNLNNLMKFFTQRCADDCQYETRVIANAMLELSKQFFPVTLGEWERNRERLTYTKEELRALINGRTPKGIEGKTAKARFEKMKTEFANISKDEGVDLELGVKDVVIDIQSSRDDEIEHKSPTVAVEQVTVGDSSPISEGKVEVIEKKEVRFSPKLQEVRSITPRETVKKTIRISSPKRKVTSPVRTERKSIRITSPKRKATSSEKNTIRVSSPVRTEKEVTSPVKTEKKTIRVTSPVKTEKKTIRVSSPVRTEKKTIRVSSPVRTEKKVSSPVRTEKKVTSPVRTKRKVTSPVRTSKKSVISPTRVPHDKIGKIVSTSPVRVKRVESPTRKAKSVFSPRLTEKYTRSSPPERSVGSPMKRVPTNVGTIKRSIRVVARSPTRR